MDFISIIIASSLANPAFIKELFFFFLAWMLLKKGIDKALSQLTGTLESLIKALQDHVNQTDLRISAGESRFESMQKDITEIKSHVGMK